MIIGNLNNSLHQEKSPFVDVFYLFVLSDDNGFLFYKKFFFFNLGLIKPLCFNPFQFMTYMFLFTRQVKRAIPFTTSTNMARTM